MESIGNYKILQTIVDKGPSKVCIAEHKKLGRKTFLKIYSGADSALIQRFEREARIVAELNHPSVVSIYDFGEIDGKFYISMEYIDGCNLSEFLQSHAPTVEQILDFASQIAESISVIHKKGYIHRDLKPENILIDWDNKIKITDFGISFHEGLNRVTHDGNVLGTPLYMSPEQIHNLPLKFSSDVFSLGVIFYQMAAGFHPFRSDRFGEIFSKILTVQPKSLLEINQNLPLWFAALVKKMMEKDAEKRISDAGQVFQEIQKHLQTSESQFMQPGIVGKDNFFKFTNWKYYLPTTAFVILLLAIVVATIKTKNDGIIKGKSNIVYSDSNEIPNHQQKLKKLEDELLSAKTNEQATNILKSASKINQQNAPDSTRQKQPEFAGSTPEKVNSETTFIVATWPWCRIFLNYEFVDETQMSEPQKIKPGRYLLSLQNPNYPTWSDSIEIRADQLNRFSFNLDSIYFKLTLNVFPWGEVYIDGKHIGTTPIEPVYLTRRNHFIRIQNDFFETWQDSLYWNGEDQIDKEINLKKPKHKP